MPRRSFNDLHVFVAVAKAGSFTRAAEQLEVSQPALSQTIQTLEETLGLQLLSRSSRSVATTPAGEKLLQAIAPQFSDIELALNTLCTQRDRLGGTIRIGACEHAAIAILQPKLASLLAECPDLNVEIHVDYGTGDVAAGRHDAVVGSGAKLEKGMSATRIAPDMRLAVVASPSYLAGRAAPEVPEDLVAHSCINSKIPGSDDVAPWNFEKAGYQLHLRTRGHLTVNNLPLRLAAAINAQGFTYLPEPYARQALASGQLVSVLDDWCPDVPGYHLHYPSVRKNSAVFALLTQALSYQV